MAILWCTYMKELIYSQGSLLNKCVVASGFYWSYLVYLALSLNSFRSRFGER